MPHLHDVHGNNSWDANHFHYFRILLVLAWIIGDARTFIFSNGPHVKDHCYAEYIQERA
jgi:hypothetical protein